MAFAPTTVSATFDGGALAVRRGPNLVQQMVGDDTSITFTRNARLLTAELVTLATGDADGCELRASFDGRQLRVEIADLPATTCVYRSGPAPGAGLRLVNTMASRWGARIMGTRAIVWFELLQLRDGMRPPLSGFGAERSRGPVSSVR
jgi:hypothetical protein